MTTSTGNILTINAGSSTIKFALYEQGTVLSMLLKGQMEGTGTSDTVLSYQLAAATEWSSVCVDTAAGTDADDILINWLMKQPGFDSVTVIGHRIVCGMEYTAPQLISDEFLDKLKSYIIYDPEHLPDEIKLIESFRKRYPLISQVACFDTSFHADMPPVAQLLPLPRKYTAHGMRRYGFHGISYSYLLMELERISGKKVTNGKIILAHLGNGASLCAVSNGKSIDTTMGFTPASGIPMGTRTGNIDPGVAWFLMQEKGLSLKEFNHLVNHESGLLGISGTSADMRDLLKIRATDMHAAAAINLFCYEAKKSIGALATVLGGLETLVFSGGIGEHSPEIRATICKDMSFLGIVIDEERNAKNEPVISTDNSPVCIRVISTDEQVMIARSAMELDQSNKKL